MFQKIVPPLAGGIVAGVTASACCVGPLVLLLLGFGGAWIGNLTALEPYRPVFIGVASIALHRIQENISTKAGTVV
jgi:mercuric ion transport protein